MLEFLFIAAAVVVAMLLLSLVTRRNKRTGTDPGAQCSACDYSSEGSGGFFSWGDSGGGDGGGGDGGGD